MYKRQRKKKLDFDMDKGRKGKRRMMAMNVALIVVIAAVASLLFRERIEKTLPFAACSIILFLYAFAICGVMGRGVTWALLALAVAALVFAARHFGQRENWKRAWELLLTPGLLAFLMLSTFVYWFSIHSEPTQWDEFSHWALTVKDMYYRNRLSTDALAVTSFKSYPPAMALWEYFFAETMPSFSAGSLYYAYNLFLILMVLPVFQNVRWKQAAYIAPLIAIIYAFSYTFFTYWEGVAWSCLYIDRALAFCFAYALSSCLLYTHKSRHDYLFIGFALGVLGLLKSIGHFTAAIVILIVFVDSLWYKEIGGKHRFANILLSLLPWLAAFISWKVHLALAGTPTTWSMSAITPQAITDLLTGKAEPWKYEFTSQFIHKLFGPSVWLPGVISISIAFHPFVWLILMFCANHAMGQSGNIRKTLVCWGVLFVGYVIYMISLYGTYLFLFSQSEAVGFNGIYRYPAAYWLGCYGFSLMSLLFALFQKKQKAILRVAQIACCVLFVCLTVSLDAIKTDLSLGAQRNEYYGSLTGFLMEDRLPAKEASAMLGVEDRVYVVSCGDAVAYLSDAYELLPGRTFGWRDWEGINTKEAWIEETVLNDCHYVWTASIDDDFAAKCGEMFGGGLAPKTLYRVVGQDADMRFEPVSYEVM